MTKTKDFVWIRRRLLLHYLWRACPPRARPSRWSSWRPVGSAGGPYAHYCAWTRKEPRTWQQRRNCACTSSLSLSSPFSVLSFYAASFLCSILPRRFHCQTGVTGAWFIQILGVLQLGLISIVLIFSKLFCCHWKWAPLRILAAWSISFSYHDMMFTSEIQRKGFPSVNIQY